MIRAERAGGGGGGGGGRGWWRDGQRDGEECITWRTKD